MLFSTLGRRSRAFLLLALMALSVPALANHAELVSIVPDSNVPGATTSYTVEFRVGVGNLPLPSGEPNIRITWPNGYTLSPVTTTVDFADSGAREAAAGPWAPFPANAGVVVTSGAGGTLRINDIAYATTPAVTMFRVVVDGVVNPATAGNYTVQVALLDAAEFPNTNGAALVAITQPPGVVLGATPATPLTYASEIIASVANPVTLTNTGAQNLRVPLAYNFSADEVRHARLECSGGMTFQPGSAVTLGGSASVGAVNGLGTGAITFSVTAGAGGAAGTSVLNVAGNRRIVGTSPVDCTYSLYDFPSQAQAGGSAGRVATLSGAYLRFASSTAFTSTGRTATADVEADPAYTRFVASAPTTAGVAALSRVTYARATPTPLTAAGTAVTLANLHATGPSGTRVVATGDFTAAANTDGSYTGPALNRVYLSTSSANCASVGIPASSVSADRAIFPVGATAADRMLCLAPRATVAIPASTYAVTLDATSAQPTVYAVPDIGPLEAGRIVRNGTELQAPLVQVPVGWIARIALTNTGSVDRTYAVRVLSANVDGSTVIDAFDLAGDLKSGIVPAGGTRVIRLDDASMDAAARRGTVVVTVAGPNNQIQGLYQVVNPNTGLVTNHVMVRPGSN